MVTMERDSAVRTSDDPHQPLPLVAALAPPLGRTCSSPRFPRPARFRFDLPNGLRLQARISVPLGFLVLGARSIRTASSQQPRLWYGAERSIFEGNAATA